MKKSQLRQIIKNELKQLSERKKVDPRKGFTCCCLGAEGGGTGTYTCIGYSHCIECCRPGVVSPCL